MSETVNNRLKGYDLDPPTKDYAIKALSRFMDEEDARSLWESACVTHNILANSTNLEDLENVFKDLSVRSGVVGVVGKSLVVRANSYKILKMKSEWNQ